MKQIIRLAKPIAILGGLLLAMPMTVMADKPDAGSKGGTPNRNSVAATALTIPVGDFEPYEGMLVTFPQQLFVSGNFTLARFGEAWVRVPEIHLGEYAYENVNLCVLASVLAGGPVAERQLAWGNQTIESAPLRPLGDLPSRRISDRERALRSNWLLPRSDIPASEQRILGPATVAAAMKERHAWPWNTPTIPRRWGCEG